jgi:hypothetical protein
MPDLLGQVAGLFTKAAPLLEGGMAGAGLVGNILNEKARSDELNYLKKNQDAAKDPVALAKMVQAATQPLNQGLVQGVENQVQGSLAEQGLAQAPGIQASVLAQSLAPFQQQNQQTALQLVMQKLGIPLEYASAYLSGLPKDTNLSPLLALLQKNAGGGSTGSSPTPQQLLNMFGGDNWGTTTSGSPYGTPGIVGDFNLPDISAGAPA